MDYDVVDQRIVPNYMQRKALKELNRNRALGIQRSLIISATGSGKTYLAAFDALNFGPKKLLYAVHEGSILRRSLETFQDVFGGKSRGKTVKSREKIIALLSENGKLTAAGLAAEIGVTAKAVEKHLAKLKAEGIIEREGPDKGGSWKVK